MKKVIATTKTRSWVKLENRDDIRTVSSDMYLPGMVTYYDHDKGDKASMRKASYYALQIVSDKKTKPGQTIPKKFLVAVRVGDKDLSYADKHPNNQVVVAPGNSNPWPAFKNDILALAKEIGQAIPPSSCPEYAADRPFTFDAKERQKELEASEERRIAGTSPDKVIDDEFEDEEEEVEDEDDEFY